MPQPLQPSSDTATSDEPCRDTWPSDTVRDRLIGDWHIYQRRGGHRTSTDDFLTAWFAVEQAASAPQRYLDLGCGIGSVLFMVAHTLRPATSLGVEAQQLSTQLASRSLAELPANAPHLAVQHSDFRHANLPTHSFDLITGSPPYFAIGSGVLPSDPQRRACRFETRGGIEAYCDAAAKWLAPEGVFVVVFQTSWDARVLAAAQSTSLQLTARADVAMRSDKRQPFLSLYAFRQQGSDKARQQVPCEQRRFAVREAGGEWTAAYRQARRRLGYEGER